MRTVEVNHNRSSKRFSAVLPALLATAWLALVLAACSEKDVPFVVDEDELIRYIEEDDIARELFSTAGLVDTASYTMPYDNAVYRDSLLALERTYLISVLPPEPESLWADYGVLGMVREGGVVVRDRVTLQTTRDYGDSIRVDTTLRQIKRYGFFLKLGDDSEDYVGWLLWGFNGIGSYLPQAETRVELFDGSSFSGDLSLYRDIADKLVVPDTSCSQYFLKLSDVTQVPTGSRLVVQLSESPSQPDPSSYVLAGRDTAGTFWRPMDRTNEISVDTVRTPRTNPPTYNLLMVHEFDDDDFRYRGSWCIPYKM
ncbi:hypothetical protein GF377_05735 [candidate division GN15 bacterium]|nr:hypothetical protein [candidate division GN15 bacterium]